jgi:hypothetical protein
MSTIKEGSTESASGTKDRSDPILAGIDRGLTGVNPSFGRFLALGSFDACSLRLKYLPKFLPSMTWLRISLRASGSALPLLVETMNGMAPVRAIGEIRAV